MISLDQIKKIQTKQQTNLLNVTREYLQHIFLKNLYQLDNSEQLLFKGGTALRIVYQSPRFSEDLDFTGKKINKREIENILITTLKQMEKRGVQVKLGEAKTTSGGYLSICKAQLFNQDVRIKIDISLRGNDKEGESELIAHDYFSAYNLIHLSEEELVAEKVRALLSRQNDRDFYDLYFIFQKRLEIKLETIGIERKELRNQLISAIDQKETLQRSLKVLLPKSHHNILPNFKDKLKKKVKRYI